MRNEEMIARTNARNKGGEQVAGGNVTYQRGQSGINIGQVERILSGVGGGLLLKRNLFNLSLPGILKMAIGAGLLRRGFTGHCNMYKALNFSSARADENTKPGASEGALPVHAEMSVAVPPMQAYEIWRDPANQRWIFGHFASMDSISMDRAHWKVRFPISLEWDALIVADSPGEYLSWESLPGAGIPNEGTVRFVPTQSGGTRVVYDSHFDPPAGEFSMSILRMIGFTPESVIGKALRKFKDMAEMGLMKSTGPRSLERGPVAMQEKASV